MLIKDTAGMLRRLSILLHSLFLLISSQILAEPLLFQACEIGDPQTNLSVRAECSTLQVPINPEEPDGKKLTLFIAKLEARSSDKRSDPLTILAGGPGQSATETFPPVQSAFEPIRKHRDIYLIDQRGTGRSNKLSCPRSADDSDSLQFDAFKISEDAKSCLDSLDSDPRFFTTSVAVRDLDLVRQALDIAEWNIYGISYGTRVGLHYLRQYPDAVRTLILDAVVPPTISLGSTISLSAEDAFQQMLDRCESSAHCNEAFPDLAANSRNLMQSLKEAPKEITFENFNTGKLETLSFQLEHLTTTLRMLSYSSHGISLLPALLHNAYNNDNFAPLARQARLQAENLGSTLASGMHNAVICTEDVPFIDMTDDLRNQMEETFLGVVPIEALNASCRYWPQGVLDETFKTPVTSDKPVLILSGGADPVTPPEFGEEVKRTLTNSLHIINPSQGHMQAWLGCTPGIMNSFLEHASPEEIDDQCLDRQQPLPFFVNSNGPQP